MRRKLCWATLVFLLAGTLVAFLRWKWGESAPRPNVLIISIDTCRADHIGCLDTERRLAFPASDQSATPGLDRFAKGCGIAVAGVTAVPLTLPAHLSMMTGLYPDETGVRENDSLAVPAAASRDYSLLAEDLLAAGYDTAAFVSGQPLDHRCGLSAGFQSYDDVREGRARRNSYRERNAEKTTLRARDWLRGRSRGKPFLLFVHYFDPHDPYVRRPEYSSWPKGRRWDYLAEIAGVDRQISLLLGEIPEDTVVVVVGDHGEGLGQHGEDSHGFLLHESTLRIPFFLRIPPGRPQAADLDGTLPSLLDVYPTVLALCGVNPQKVARRSGRNLLEPAPPDWGVRAETLYPYYQFRYARIRSYRDRNSKLIEEGGRLSVFSWSSDPHEDEARSEGAQELLRRLRESLGGARSYAAKEVASTPNSANPYFGSRSPKDLEPTDAENRRLPLMSEHFEVVDALNQARSQLRGGRGGNPDPGAALRLLRPFEDQRDQNPALLYWTARATYLVAQDRALEKALRIEFLQRADALFARDASRFGNSYAKDSRLKIRLDRYRLESRPDLLAWIQKAARGRVAEGSQTANTHIFLARALEWSGDLPGALAEFRKAARLDDADPRIRQDIARLSRRVAPGGR